MLDLHWMSGASLGPWGNQEELTVSAFPVAPHNIDEILLCVSQECSHEEVGKVSSVVEKT